MNTKQPQTAPRNAPLLTAHDISPPVPNPVISRNCPAYSAAGTQAAAPGNDGHYFPFFQAKCPDYLAYDLSGVSEAERQVINAVWYCDSTYDAIGKYQNRSQEPSDYTIEINKAPGGICLADGWETVVTVTGNTLASRQHVLPFSGYHWIRMNVSGADGRTDGAFRFHLDIHNVSDGVSDSWLFLGDSITACGMHNCYGTGFAACIHRLDKRYFPAQENGGIGGIRSADGRAHIGRWLSAFPGKYVSIAFGTNDAWGNNTGADRYYENTAAMIQAILNAGKIPVLPRIPHATEPDIAVHLAAYNAKIEQLYREFPQVIPGPDFDAIIAAHPEYLSGDGVHPCAAGYEEMRRIWAETMYARVYSAPSAAVTDRSLKRKNVILQEET